jgi:hypothetical protein
MTTLNLDRFPVELWDESDKWLGGPSLEGRADQAYSEQAFRYFLGLEGRRAERSGRSLLLMLVHLEPDSNGGPFIPAAIAPKLFAGLSRCVRDVDFIGWYRTDQVAGAVLTQGVDSPGLDVSDQIRRRVIDLLGQRLPAHVMNRLQVRVLQVRQGQQG